MAVNGLSVRPGDPDALDRRDYAGAVCCRETDRANGEVVPAQMVKRYRRSKTAFLEQPRLHAGQPDRGSPSTSTRSNRSPLGAPRAYVW
jgi:hypothetical protein